MDKRSSRRRELHFPARVLVNGAIYDCIVYDISQTGARLTIAGDKQLPPHFQLDMTRNASVVRHCSLVWQDRFAAGVRFTKAPTANDEPSDLHNSPTYV